jgi:hypothetical protein
MKRRVGGAPGGVKNGYFQITDRGVASAEIAGVAFVSPLWPLC